MKASGVHVLRDLLAVATRDPDSLYQRRKIPKPNGGVRTLYVPGRALRIVQRRILDQYLAPHLDHQADHCRRGRSVITNAQSHQGHAYVSTYDIADCFPSVTPPMVRAALLATGIPDSWIDDWLALTTYQGQLPQGAATSSALLSLVMKPVDDALSQLAGRHGSTYTRYVDDITLSANKPVEFLGAEVERVLRDTGFAIMTQKTTHRGPRERRVVTHIVLGPTLSVEPAYQRAVEREVHLVATGRVERHLLPQLRGQIGWIRQVNPRVGRKLAAALDAALRSSANSPVAQCRQRLTADG
jgi:RNA-directed DNA polymerase